ncbi:heme-binding protein [Maricaulis sp.]|uniref:GlcG/HbpS family heme-binding protein n=1 Tax=Maricaulis sp. TaxID=1486257 RepID=UPI002B27B208|nr:heme-binding protein [Maricaulis sp.]
MMQRILTIFAALFAVSAPVAAQDSRVVLNTASAQTIIETCQAWAVERDLRVNIAVYDQGVDLIGFLRMDGAPLASIQIAQWKGESAAGINFSTGALAGFATENPVLAHAPAIAVLRGGVPILAIDGTHIGGVGVSGASSEDDEHCAVAAIEAAGLVANLPAEE